MAGPPFACPSACRDGLGGTFVGSIIRVGSCVHSPPFDLGHYGLNGVLDIKVGAMEVIGEWVRWGYMKLFRNLTDTGQPKKLGRDDR